MTQMDDSSAVEAYNPAYRWQGRHSSGGPLRA